ncbi:Gfo/Idh/MocA family oxidoreductase [Streptococcus sp. NLN64]|uniref:Gfo/Idh/MocA family protein n=1 Tax=Streptococcus sp. NLN64 TaxID=2822799 RepID=UPI0018CAFD6A|nr:Gfo/Idh/MocA family oxidoreductase [Streptococcus sp. NLN64]MBG9367026.1 Gfo/Idh/MocA family oxidoreductase [Streptococcus sp. NLN64]
MITFGILATSPIAHEWMKAVTVAGGYKLGAVYSRSLEKAQAFADQYGSEIETYDSLESFLADPKLDLIYIASPNGLHFQHSRLALEGGKHVVVEKPAVLRPFEWASLFSLAKEKGAMLFEAARNVHEKAVTLVSDFLKNQEILGANLRYGKYSSKMPSLLAGELPNVFSATFGGGALMDLGIYPLYVAHYWFGKPDQVSYQAQKWNWDVDLAGQANLVYPRSLVTIQTAKNYTTYLPSEIYTRQGTLILDSVEEIKSVRFRDLAGEEEMLPVQAASHQMAEEAMDFAQIIENEDWLAWEKWAELALDVHETIWKLRQAAAIVFEGDKDAE